MILLTPILAAVLWLFSMLWLTGKGLLAFALLACGLIAIFTLNVPSRFRKLASIALGSLVLLVTLWSQYLAQTNSPQQLAEQAWKISSFSLEVEASKNSYQLEARISEPRAIRGTTVLVNQTEKSNFPRGCRITGDFRVVPVSAGSVSWLLKPQSDLYSISCEKNFGAAGLRETFGQSLTGITRDSTALVSGLAIGDDSKISDKAKREMRAVSLTHLTAVSGANCAIVIGLVILLMRRAPLSRWLRTGFSTVALVGYVLVVGSEPSVLRAATMTFVLMVCTLSGRPVLPTHSLSLAVILLIIADPFIALELGFALSVAATLGLLTLTPMFYRKLRDRLPRWAAASVSVSAAAQVWCLPLLLDLQGGLPTYSLLANSLADPLVAPITVLGLLALILSPLFPGLAACLSWLASFPAALILWVAENLNRLPMLTLWWPVGVQGLVLLMLFALALTCFSIKKRAIGALLTAISLGWLSATSAVAAGAYTQWPVPGWSIVNCDVGQGDALVIRSNDQVALVDVGREDEPIDECLDRLEISTIDLLILTHFDADHVGGLTGAISNRTVLKALLTDYEDDRPQVDWLTTEIESVATVQRAHAGMQGQLGEIVWTVLQPEAKGVGSEDSNDGSVAMRWDSALFTLFTMADLGERGQMRMVQKHPAWVSVGHDKPVILKVSHHGSADQYPELIESWQPDVALISVGKNNSYGHPTTRLLNSLEGTQTSILRTDISGALSLAFDTSEQRVRVGVGG